MSYPVPVTGLVSYIYHHLSKTVGRENTDLFAVIFFSPQTVGVIVRLEKENFQVLSMHNKVRSLNLKFMLNSNE